MIRNFIPSAALCGNTLWKSWVLALLLLLAGFSQSKAQTYATSQVSTVYGAGACPFCSVVNQSNPINNGNLNDYSQFAITAGLPGVSVEQVLIFPGSNSNAGAEEIVIGIGADNTPLTANLFAGVTLQSKNGAVLNPDNTAAPSRIRIVDGGARAEIVFRPTALFDRVSVLLVSVNVGLLQGLRIYYAYHQPALLPNAQGTLFVKKGSNGTGNSWSNAVGELSDALKAAKMNTAIKQIWVAGGTYKPLYSGNDNGDASNSRNSSFVLVNNVKMYGGFAGTETSLSGRDLSANQTILSGDIDNNDRPDGTIIGSNSLHVVIATGSFNYHLDGFVIQGGMADQPATGMVVNGIPITGDFGSAIYAESSAFDINACRIRANYAESVTLHFLQCKTMMANTEITSNTVRNGFHLLNANSVLDILNNTIANNQIIMGYLAMNAGTTTIRNSIIYGNSNNNFNGSIPVGNSLYEGHGGGTNIDADPQFNAPVPAGSAPFIGGDFTLKATSPAINAGNNSIISSWGGDGVQTSMMPDGIYESGCAGIGCGVTGLANLTSDDFSDYAVMGVNNTSASPGNAYIRATWVNSPIKAGDFIGFVIDAELTNPLDAALLANIELSIGDDFGNPSNIVSGLTLQTVSIGGQPHKYIGYIAPADGTNARITLRQIPQTGTYLRVHGIFKWNGGIRDNNIIDLAGKPRIANKAGRGIVDLGAYEFQTLPQTITASDISKTYGDAAFEPGATASSGLALSYASADNTIAETFQDIADGNKWKLRILRAGTVNITAKQPGNGIYEPATDKVFQLTIAPKPVTVHIKSSATAARVYDGTTGGSIQTTDFEFAAGDIINGDAVQISSSSGNITFDNKNAGTNKTIVFPLSNLGLSGAQAANYRIGNTTDLSSNTGIIKPASLQINANASSKSYGMSDPSFTYSLPGSGLFPGDDISGSLSRDPGENVGAYPITIGTVNAGSNYSISFVPANLTIFKATQTITWTQNDIEIGCGASVAPLPLTATTSSALPITYVVANTNLAIVNGDMLTPLASGTTTITATQPGDQNHEPATSVMKNFKYSLPGMIRQHWADAMFFDNTGGIYVQWQWYKNGAAVAGATKPYYSEPNNLAGSFYVVATDRNGKTIQTCSETAAISPDNIAAIKVNPNPVKPGATAAVMVNYSSSVLVNARLVLSNMSGTKLQEITQVNAVNNITMPATSGMYVITLVLNTGYKLSVNVLVK